MIYDALKQSHATPVPQAPAATPLRQKCEQSHVWTLPQRFGAAGALSALIGVIALVVVNANSAPRTAVAVTAGEAIDISAPQSLARVHAPVVVATTPVAGSLVAPSPAPAAHSTAVAGAAARVGTGLSTTTTAAASPAKPPSMQDQPGINVTTGTAAAEPLITGPSADKDTVTEVVANQIQVRVEKHPGHVNRGVDVALEARQIAQQLKQLDAALAHGDLVSAQQQLQALHEILPANSLTLLRAEAWVAHSHAQTSKAEEHYRLILDRVPGDEQASVNLALLEAARGDVEAAQGRLHRLIAQNGTTPLIARAMSQLRGDTAL